MSSFFLIWVLPFVGSLIWYIIIKDFIKAPGNALQIRFGKLTEGSGGIIAGKTYDEIVAACGSPSSVFAMADGMLCQWMAAGYHIGLQFDANKVCRGVSFETKI